MTIATSAFALPPVLVNPREAARLLSISTRKLWSLTKSGEVRSMKVGRVVRYRVDELDAWTKRMTMVQSNEVSSHGQHQQ